MATVFVPITKNGETRVMKIDLVDYLKIERKIYSKLARNNKWYASFKLKNKHVMVHRLVMSATSSDVVDHLNMDTLDNRSSNLRICTHQENARNRDKRSDSKQNYKGVHKKKNRYRAMINADKKRICLGYHKTEIEAVNAYNEAAKKYHGEFARLNKLTGGGLSESE